MRLIAHSGMKKAALGSVLAFLLLSPGALLEAGTIRGHATGGHRGGGHHTRIVTRHPYYYPYQYPYHSPYYYGYPSFYGYGIGFTSYGYAPRYAYPAPYGAQVGFVDTDISPEEAQVYLDGEYVGTADDFDGFPAYLPVEPGKHEITFKAGGFRSVTKRMNAPPGAVLSFDFKLPEGAGGEADEERAIQGEVVGTFEGESEKPEAEGEEGVGPGFVALKVSPADASIYLDGEFLGSAAMVSRLHGSLRLESGKHRIEVVRPGRDAVSREVIVRAGARLTLEIDLKESGTLEAP